MTGLTQLLAGNNSNPNFSWVTNNNFRAALTEAAYSGLVMGFAGPASPQYWLRGTQYSSFLGVPGATYTRTGNRAGLDAAVIYYENLIRSSDNLQWAGWFALTGAVITGAATATLAATANSRVEQQFSGTAAGSTNTISVVVSGAGNIRLQNKDMTGANGSTFLDVTLTSTPTRYSITRTSVDSGTILTIANFSGIAVTDLQIQNAQLVRGNVAGPYIPNPSTTQSASQPRIAPSSGLRVFGAGTNLILASEDMTLWALQGGATVAAPSVASPTGTLASLITGASDLIAPTGGNNIIRTFNVSPSTQYTISVWLRAGTATTAGISFFDGTTGNQSNQTISVNTTWQRVTVTRTSGPATTGMRFTIGGANGTFAAWGAQLEQSAFASDYIPNPNTSGSSSAGADDVQVAASALPTSGPIVFLADLPDQNNNLGAISPRVFEWGGATVQNQSTAVTASTGTGTAASVSGLPASGARRIAILYTVGAAARLSVNGSTVAVGGDIGDPIGTGSLQVGNNVISLIRPLVGSLGVFAVYRATPSDAQLQAMSALS